MEKTEKTVLSDRPIDNVKIGGAGCGFWFMGDDKSAENDLKNKFDVVNEKDNG